MLARPLVVLDLDETLWHAHEHESCVTFQLRPYLREFLETVAAHYDLAVWTSATEHWMLAGLDAIFASTSFDLHKEAFSLASFTHHAETHRGGQLRLAQTCPQVPCSMDSGKIHQRADSDSR
ncbi:hypothetical protein D3875_18660 [Deinococcus cavernae]|uniref:FCP1 homology domain-containing protein n=1 Tax=Deinococcus cavernae TaxID=2320857 RepID=A0A418VB76_9DEIO|nr:hypothetical protein D3875_18660 [Deinococcus cavernae]